ncbi:hypothetical protein [Pengzhenrongella sp.]|uniref:hypothetical protein n=1 Tax=Pengzhenrongella sp. TaxID=2888820 RepID=UPI002F92E1B2
MTKIRTPGSILLPLLGASAISLTNAALLQANRPGWPFAWVPWFLLGVGCLLLLEVLWLRTLGIDLTPELAVIRGFRRRDVPWRDVQAVFGRERRDVQLILESGEAVTLPAPRNPMGRHGEATYDRDYHRIGQWWLAHRGADWTPAAPRA